MRARGEEGKPKPGQDDRVGRDDPCEGDEMSARRCGEEEGRTRERRFPTTAIIVTLMMMLALAQRGLSGWAPMEGLLDPIPNGEFLGDVAQAALWLAYRGLRRLGLPEIGIGRACAPEA
jgi:hypothetical protein